LSTHREALAEASRRLARAGIADSVLDARLLLQHAVAVDHAGLISRLPLALDTTSAERFGGQIERRIAGEPVSRILGRRAFHGLELIVTPDVLDPRPETELLVELALADFADRATYFCDIGTGSGAIAVALLAALPKARAVATDISEAALEVARANAAANGVAARLEFVATDLLSGVTGPFDFIVSNPPYIETAAIGGLAREVALFDPPLALDGGADGLDAYRRIFAQAASRMKPGARLYLEFGAGQSGALARLAAAQGWHVARIVADLAGIDRAMIAALS